MKKLIFFLATILTLSVYGQEREKKWQIGINFSPDYCYRMLKNNNGGTMADFVIATREELETPRWGYTAGLNFGYNFSKHFAIETGIQLSSKGEATDVHKVTLRFGDRIDDQYGFIPPSGKQITELKSSYSSYIYSEIPVRAIFLLGAKKIRFVTSLGITTNIFIVAKSKSIVKMSDGSTATYGHDMTTKFKTINLSPMASIGIDYKISNRINLRAEPTYRYGILKITDTPVTAYLWNAGLNLSC